MILSRYLVFKVEGQRITRENPSELIVAGTYGYFKAKFLFSSDWDGYQKVAGFYTKHGKELPPKEISSENTCEIPKEALELHEFTIKLFGKDNGRFITTKPISIIQYGGK